MVEQLAGRMCADPVGQDLCLPSTESARAPSGGTCAPCVAHLEAPSDRVAAMRSAIAEEREPMVALTHLLRHCRDDHRTLWERSVDARSSQAVAAVIDQVRPQLPAPGTMTELGPRVRHALVTALEPPNELPPVLVARALAELIDERYNRTFAHWFRCRSPYQPGVGDPVPLDSPDLRAVMAMRATTPPWRLAHRLDETRHIRLAGDWGVQFRIVFDYSLFETLAGLITAETVVATCHPNRRLDEFDLTHSNEDRTFPVRPRDLDQQRNQIERLVAQATAAGASIVVLPELSVTGELAEGLGEWVQRSDGPRVLVCGSYHHAAPADGVLPARRRNTAIAWVRGYDRPLTHDKYSPADRPVFEDIQPDGWPELRVYVTADGWHLVIEICRDLLNPQAANALSEAGTNLLLVPAMSDTLVPFGGPVAHLVGARQALVAVANNPGEWSGDADRRPVQPARAMFGHPGLGQQSRLVQPPDPAPGVALMTVRSAAITWLPAEAPTRMRVQRPDAPAADRARPEWLAPLIGRTHPPVPSASGPTQPVRLRPAAVLVLLTDGPEGPSVLLTQRAADLADYPGQLSFPGGVVEAGDGDAVATALREAQEEVGLDPSSLEILGLLDALALPQSGFMVDPVLAWSGDAVLTRSINHAEVAALHHVPLHALAQRTSDPDNRHCGAGARPSTGEPDLATLGRMTAAVIDHVLGMLAATRAVC